MVGEYNRVSREANYGYYTQESIPLAAKKVNHKTNQPNVQAKSCTCVPKCQEKNHTLACAVKKKTNLHQDICAHHPLRRTLLLLTRRQSMERTLAQPTDCTEGKTSLKTNSFLEGTNSSSLNWHRYLISKQARYLG